MALEPIQERWHRIPDTGEVEWSKTVSRKRGGNRESDRIIRSEKGRIFGHDTDANRYHCIAFVSVKPQEGTGIHLQLNTSICDIYIAERPAFEELRTDLFGELDGCGTPASLEGG
ncbi:hypothetical protein N7517_010869 [Penicillium concentricum]|uniref:Uncharacterized protein n=1 Tax=Penicillium concentricum TaxID=293559 RepID=A0A9W9UUV2_9EURO|nr:uncharacterized protein N7517_010869 [Penicillium concentricum]KAJ5356260.1 hypothetical protein N7517_010869 [Penicillium concentricum]